MSELENLPRRRFLMRVALSAGVLVMSGCQKLSESEWFPKVLALGERASAAAGTLIVGRKAMAQEFTAADLSPTFRSNGTALPDNPAYQALAAQGFADYRLEVGGKVAAPRRFSLAELRALDARTQITRHDCVEGWSAIGKWKGAKLSAVLDAVRPDPGVRYVVFHCADPMDEDGGSPYYESIDMDDAFHAPSAAHGHSPLQRRTPWWQLHDVRSRTVVVANRWDGSADSTSARLATSNPRSGASRSEERRVGKECRSRWSPYH